MSPRRHLLPLLSALTLLLSPFAYAPLLVGAQGNDYVVDTLSDNSGPGCETPVSDGDCSLRQAIERANADSGASSINFDPTLIGGVMQLDDPNVPLPALSANGTTVNGRVNPRGANTQIAIDGRGSLFNGFSVTGSNNRIIGLSVYGFRCSAFGSGGIVVERVGATGASGNVIELGIIGLLLDGSVPADNQRNCNGIVIRNGASSTSVRNNIISGNAGDGVLIQNASDNTVVGNLIGLGIDASETPAGNQQNGVNILSLGGQSTQRNTVGSATGVERNVISGNGIAPTFVGLRVSGSGTITTTITGNIIGLNSAGNADRGNTGDGILIQNAAQVTTLQGTTVSPLVVSGNDGNGIRVTGISGSVTRNTSISGVFVGTNGAGGALGSTLPAATIPNTGDGIRIDGFVNDAAVSGGTTTNRTIVAGNGGVGVHLNGGNVVGARISTSLIGLVPAGTGSTAQPNVAGGVRVTSARNTTLTGNTISGNAQFGLRLSATRTTTVTNNVVGLSLNRKVLMGNNGPGILLLDTNNTRVGGPNTAPNGDVNYVSGNAGIAISVSGSNSLSNTVQSNLIGLMQAASSSNYTVAAPNTGEGVAVIDGADLTVVRGNTVAGNSSTPGVRIEGTATLTVSVTGNRIGCLSMMRCDGTPLRFPNSDGIAVNGARNVEVLTNTVQFGTGVGVRLTDVQTVTVRANSPVAYNLGGGVAVSGASRNLVVASNVISASGRSDATTNPPANPNADGLSVVGSGFAVQVLSNTLRLNSGRAIFLDGTTRRVTMRYNSLTQNGGSILLNGTTRNAPGDPNLPNHDIDPPVDNLSSPLRLRVSQNGIIEGYVYTSTSKLENALNPPSACVTCTIQVFRPDPALVNSDGQGWQLIRVRPEGSSTFRDQISGLEERGRFVAQIQGALPRELLLQATDGYGHSSEYARLPINYGLVIGLTTPSPLAQSAAPGQTVTYTLQVRNTGTVDFNNLELRTGGTLPGWTLGRVPATNPFALRAGEERTLTVTLRLPTGSAESVRVPKKDTTLITITSPGLVTATTQLETTVLPRAVLAVNPRTSTGSGLPSTVVPHRHTITNNGNITVTVALDYRTVDAADSNRIWNTALNATTLTIGPGRSANFLVSVTVPPGAQQGAQATTTITGTATSTIAGVPPITLVFTDTTRADLLPNAIIYADQDQPAAARSEVRFFHTVENKSNGVARFCLDYVSNQQSVVRFESGTNGFVIDANGCFTLDVTTDPVAKKFQIAQFVAVVQTNEQLLPNDVETINIFLRKDSPTGETVGGASLVDTIRITQGTLQPRLWLPFLANQSPTQ